MRGRERERPGREIRSKTLDWYRWEEGEAIWEEEYVCAADDVEALSLITWCASGVQSAHACMNVPCLGAADILLGVRHWEGSLTMHPQLHHSSSGSLTRRMKSGRSHFFARWSSLRTSAISFRKKAPHHVNQCVHGGALDTSSHGCTGAAHPQ